MATTTVMEYMSGLTAFSLDKSILQTIAIDRGVDTEGAAVDLTQKEKDLLLADILFSVCCAPEEIPSHSHQHGQFSVSTGKQTIGDKTHLYNLMRSLYAKWNDDKLDLVADEGVVEFVNEYEH